MSVFHFELRSGIQVAHAFNLSRADLDRLVLGAWRRGAVVEFGDRRWPPDRAQLKVYEGRMLTGPELSFGRGWTNAVKRGEDVTDRLLAAAAAGVARPAIPAELDTLRREVLAQCRPGPIGVHEVLRVANRWYPDRRASERLALAEAAVWGLLHEQLILLRRAPPGRGPGGGVAEAGSDVRGAFVAKAGSEVAGAPVAEGGSDVRGALVAKAGSEVAGALVAEGGSDVSGEVVAKGEWEGVLLDWRTWADAAPPRALIEAAVSAADAGG